MHFHLPVFGRACAAALLGGALLLGTATAASAHVTVHPDSTEPGGYAELTFRVPTESATASTTKLVVTLPQDTPLASVSTKPVDGWDTTVEVDELPDPVKQEGGATLTKAPHVVTWRATSNGAAIRPGQYQTFSISTGRLPNSGTLAFPATQYYSDGSVIKWNQHAQGRAEPEHPAPTFTIGDNGHATSADPAAPTATTASGAADSASRWLSVAALSVALIALGLGGKAVGRGRHGAASASTTTQASA